MKQPENFDPAKGCQIQSTGVLGGFLILALMFFYALYIGHIIPVGDPRIPHIFSFFPARFRFDHVARDYYDILFITMTGFVFMVCWEFLNQKTERLILLFIAGLGLWNTWLVSNGAVWFEPAKLTFSFLGFEWTRFEIVVNLLSLSLSVFFLSRLLRKYTDKIITIHLSPLGWAFKTAFFRWLAGLIVFSLVWLIFFNHPFYLNNYYENWRITCGYLYSAYLFLGLPYAFITNWIRGKENENRSDPGFVLLLLLREGSLALFKNKNKKRFWRACKNHRTGIVLRDLLVKYFFVPLMTSFLFSECANFFRNLSLFQNNLQVKLPTFDPLFGILFHSIFVIDVSLGLIGYVCSSRWLHNKSVGVEGTLSGWLVAIMCYPPFNDFVGNLLPYSANFGQPFALFQSVQLDHIFKITTLLLYGIYVWATMCFGLRFSNLTHRGIITRGPYALIRHPAYISKNLAWWLENIRNFASPWQFIFLGLWNFIYFLRAITEERHLSKDPDYRAYCDHVKYRFIPGIW